MFYIKSIKMNNFRCYLNKKVDFSPDINILYGENAAGKTSTIEGIAYLGILKSFRDAKDCNLIKEKEEYFYVNGKFEDDAENEKYDITVSYNGKDKKIKKNSYIYKKNSDYIGFFNVVSFDPTDLNLIKGGPIERRKLMNVNLSQINNEYLLSLMKYNKILKKRNEYLKTVDSKTCDKAYLETITCMLATEAEHIIRKRKEFIDNLNPFAEKESLRISSDKEKVHLIYQPNVSEENVKSELLNKMNYDIAAKTTTVGPHRDEIDITINDQMANIYASQGQIRTSVIAIKLALCEYLKQSNEKQIILLDDVFSELDANRQKELLENLKEKSQIFITTTNIDNINSNIVSNSLLIEFKKGE